MTDWVTVQGSQPEKPVEFDVTSSTVVVYQRRNIRQIEVQNEDGTVSKLWEYEERQLPHDEYSLALENSQQEKMIAALENALCEIDAGN